MNQAYKLNKMTGAEVLVIVQTSREKRFYGTGELRKKLLEGTLKATDDFKDEGSTMKSAMELGVTPLEATPSP